MGSKKKPVPQEIFPSGQFYCLIYSWKYRTKGLCGERIDIVRGELLFMKVKKEEKIRSKKKIILDALRRRLVTDVYSKITVQDIADEAGFSKGGVLHYYSTKEDIYVELIEDIFTDFEAAHRSVFDWDVASGSMAPISALVGVENFIMDKNNVKIMINLILYAFEEEKIMNMIRKFLIQHRYFYNNIIVKDRMNHPSRRRSDLDPKYLARIAQIIVLYIGLMESIDPIELDPIEVVKYITSLLRG
jgi:AcrR family transcriptional regulator